MARAICKACERPCSVCLCDCVSRQDNAIPVLILRHSDEVGKSLNTVKLLTLGLTMIEVWDGVQCSSEKLSTWLEINSLNAPVLLYPKPLSQSCEHYVLSDGVASIANLEKHRKNQLPFAMDCLIALDGTWRNTRELLIVNDWIKSLNTLSLERGAPSSYRIRQANDVSSLSTIEAVGQVMSVVEEGFDLSRLLKPFHKMIDYQIERMGHDTYQRNYLKG